MFGDMNYIIPLPNHTIIWKIDYVLCQLSSDSGSPPSRDGKSNNPSGLFRPLNGVTARDIAICLYVDFGRKLSLFCE